MEDEAYGGTVSPESKIVCTGRFRKFAVNLGSLPANIACAAGITLMKGAEK
jgi:hypothetical protein